MKCNFFRLCFHRNSQCCHMKLVGESSPIFCLITKTKTPFQIWAECKAFIGARRQAALHRWFSKTVQT